jgi:hypothetical protein
MLPTPPLQARSSHFSPLRVSNEPNASNVDGISNKNGGDGEQYKGTIEKE